MSDEATTPAGLTWDQFLNLPEETRNAALIDGKVRVNPPNAQHETVVGNLWILFRQWIRAGEGRGEASTQQPVKINDLRGYQPDFMWYPHKHCAPPDEPAAFSGPPSLVVEVFSPSTRSFDLVRKRVDYERIGIGEVWFVDPRTCSVLLCQRADDESPYTDTEIEVDGELTSRLLDGFVVPVRALFER